ncbi:MAG TPA: STAS domain-containing protein [Gaiellaceae bacterium]|nr:STAS domain-containing protein [Gaiellaceae bacterium]
MHRVDVDRSNAAVVVSAGGELDAYAAPDLSQAFTSVTGEARVVVDLEAVSFLDSTALGIVVKAIREIDERSGTCLLVMPAGPARRIFEITTLDRVLAIAPSRGDALSALAD